ncbi:Transcriptional activator HAP2 [Dictyocoela roeselum]|nr:Transcriptional activator HAP2 [Dictyocoela roeselum]
MDRQDKIQRSANDRGTPPEMYKDELQYENDKIVDALDDDEKERLLKDKIRDTQRSNENVFADDRGHEKYPESYASGMGKPDFHAYFQNSTEAFPGINDTADSSYNYNNMGGNSRLHVHRNNMTMESEVARQNMMRREMLRQEMMRGEMLRQDAFRYDNLKNEKSDNNAPARPNSTPGNFNRFNMQREPSYSQDGFYFQQQDKMYSQNEMSFDPQNSGFCDPNNLFNPDNQQFIPLSPFSGINDVPSSMELYKDRYYEDAPEQPIYVNMNQYECIKKRKVRREYLDSIMEKRTGYLHESRHRHAMNRLRAPSGRFLTKEEMQELKKNKEVRNGNNNSNNETGSL